MARRTADDVPTSSRGMKKYRLGSSDLMFNEVSPGTMTWGAQNTEAEAHEQLDYA